MSSSVSEKPKQATGGLLPALSVRHADPMRYPDGVAYMDGQYLPISEAKISVLDWGFLHSDATYDTVHVWNGRFFRLDLHLDRFLAGVEKLRMRLPFGRAEIIEVLLNCAALSRHRDAYVEMICTRGSSPNFSRDPRDAQNRFIAFAVPWGSVANETQRRTGLNIAISEITRIPPRSIDPSIKNYHWLDLVRGLYEAYDRNADTAVVLDLNGNVAEGPGFNIFAVKAGRLKTPAIGVLPGVTRRTVFDLCSELGIPAEAGDVAVTELRTADEVFITSTAGGIMAVTRIDGAPVADGKIGPVTQALTELYWKKHDDPAWSLAVPYAD
jgi:branched-chain amino acid aminotransferase